MSAKVIERLEERGHPHSYEHIGYKHAGHSISSPYLPSSKGGFHSVSGMPQVYGGKTAANAYAGVDSLARTLALFQQNL